MCRVGYVAKGVVYAIVGILAIQYAFFAGGDAAGSRDALQSLAVNTWGFVLLLLIGIGLIEYVSLQVVMSQPYGPWMVAIVGVGFIAYAAYCFSRGRYRDRITR